MFAKKSGSDSTMKVSTLLGEDSVFEGNLTSRESTRIDGTIHGNVKTEAVLVLGQKGKIKGNIEARNVVVGGQVDGDIVATEKVEIMETAKINGNITTKSLVIDENAVFQGSCNMAAAQSNPEDKKEESTAAQS